LVAIYKKLPVIWNIAHLKCFRVKITNLCNYFPIIDIKYLLVLDEEINQYKITGLKRTDKLAEELNDDVI
jgi:hypothetical protein